jgi:DNA-binding transcriptional ArsR family regulator
MKLLRLLDEAGVEGASPTIEHLAMVLGVSPSTVGRDLKALRDEGHRVATRGQLHAS